ncbi:hypothetical protein HBI46_233770 [Parastagonospora nodorum]|nr:hypothetical protein HBH72_167010 [Parastagonospora nodorum]KAH5400163.1 hypothetical protein HBI46_233770 [Parastagonospora nodorum]KAH5431440.1 hypothetical protein HBI32_060460 [Parastagonospora nodorum]KAH6308333.1 hypothetical protein HBI39_091720 [Parastagonospora nodorum]KAH6402025.1 hypothetical protein HBI60_071740 [Parastagonospora nodorum]
MKSHKKPSIKDFFKPVPRKTQESAKDAPQLQDASSTRPEPTALPWTNLHQVPAHQSTNRSVAHSSPSPSAVPPVPINNSASSPDAQPPTTSQTSVNSGVSKRVVSNGEHVVLNSDSDDDSLKELDFGVPTTGFKAVAPITRSKRTTQYDEDGLRKPEKKAKSKQDHLDRVVETAKKTRELELIINERKADLEKHVEEDSNTDFVFDENALGQAVQDDDDPEKAHRLFLAMQRTNATHIEHVFHFFSQTQISPATKSSFPSSCLPKHRWTTAFRDESTRDQAFLTGFAHQAFRLQDLPEELASWMIDQICFERSDALDLKYMEILEAHDHYLRKLLDRDRLDSIFRYAGADMAGCNTTAQVSPFVDPQTSLDTPLPRSLRSIARLLAKVAPHLRIKARSYALSILIHTCLDDRARADPCVLSTIQEAIEATMCNFVDNRKLTHGVGSSQPQDEDQTLIASQLSDVLPQLLARITHPVMQRDLVYALPTRSPLTAYFQRHLALSFLVHPGTVEVPLGDPEMPAFIHKLLKTSPNFRINKNTDYCFLTARITLLDIAVGPGLSSVPYQPLLSPAASRAGSSPIMAPAPEIDEVKNFNKEVDALAQQIKILGNSIIEAGAVADLTILDAKDSVERLCSRLEHAVRIGGKKMHDVFGDDDEVKQLKVTDIFRRVAKARKNAPAGGIFDQDDDADTDDAVTAQIKAETAS